MKHNFVQQGCFFLSFFSCYFNDIELNNLQVCYLKHIMLGSEDTGLMKKKVYTAFK